MIMVTVVISVWNPFMIYILELPDTLSCHIHAIGVIFLWNPLGVFAIKVIGECSSILQTPLA
jgi:hypothetical protein